MVSHALAPRARIARRRKVLFGMVALFGLAAIASAASLLVNPEPSPLLAVLPAAIQPPAAVGVPGSVALAPPLRGLRPTPASPPVNGPTPLPAAVAHTATTGPDHGRWHDGRPIRPSRTMRMLVTAYSPDARSCGLSADGITASGFSVWTNGMKMVAADTRLLPFGTLVSVPGYDAAAPVPVLDRGGKIKGRRLDLLFPAHEAARRWGKRWLDVTIWEYADGQSLKFVERHR